MKLQARIIAQMGGAAFVVAFLFFTIGFLHFHYSFFESRTSLAAAMLGLAFFGFLLIAGLACLHARRMSRVFEQAIRFADALADMQNKEPGKTSPMPEDSPIPEVRRLSRALNRMSDRLRTALVKLQRTHVRELETRKSLETANWIKCDFLTVASNEMIAALNSISVLEAYLEKNAADGVAIPSDQLRRYSDILHRKRMDLTAIGWLLNDLARLDDRRADLRIETFDQFEAFQKIASDMNAVVPQRRCDIEYGYANDPPRMISTDRELFMRLFHLILRAVLEGASSHSRLSCSIAKKDSGVDYVVSGSSDNPAPGEYLLYTAAQEKGGEKPGVTHSVIALTVARYLAHSLGASFEVSCRERADFQIVVSFLAGDLLEQSDGAESHVRVNRANTLLAESEARFYKPGGEALSVLLYGADKANCSLLELLLKDFQCDVVVVSNEHDAVSKIRERRCDVLCLDLSAAFGCAFPEANDLRSEWRKADMCVIAVTPKLSPTESDRLTSMGVSVQLQAPVQINLLRDAVQQARAVVEKKRSSGKN